MGSPVANIIVRAIGSIRLVLTISGIVAGRIGSTAAIIIGTGAVLTD